ncbi:MAG: choice-of-anchor X domain-containing protein, partial [Bacteroidota bacterium]
MRQLLFKINFFLFVIILLSISGCEKKYITIVDSTGYAPILNNAIFSESIINTDTINITGQSIRSPNDLITIRGIAKVTVLSSDNEKNVPIVGYSITNSQFSSSLTQGVLHDDGVFPDAKANDSVYSGYVEFQIQRVIVGSFSLNMWSESTTGYNSNTSILPLQIVRLNHPPVLSNLQSDSLVSIAGVDHVLQLRITASDSDGQSDILKVFFNTFKPNGSPSSVN